MVIRLRLAPGERPLSAARRHLLLHRAVVVAVAPPHLGVRRVRIREVDQKRNWREEEKGKRVHKGSDMSAAGQR